MSTRILASALFAGAAAGLIAAVLQLLFVQPVLLHAELYESGALVQAGAQLMPAHPDLPGFDLMRDALSVLFSMFTYTGYAFVVVAAMAFAEDRGAQIDGRTGLIWGVAGFVAVHFAPAFSLPPEVPGVASADLTPRQIWWFGCVAVTAIGLWMIAFGKRPAFWAIGVALIAAPHVIGAPSPAVLSGPAPTEIGALFTVRALGIGFVAWALLGVFTGFFWQRER